jgi:hypothetical protein
MINSLLFSTEIITTLNLENRSSSLSGSSTLLAQTNPKTVINSLEKQSVLKSELSLSTINSKTSLIPSSKLTTHLSSTIPNKLIKTSFPISSLPNTNITENKSNIIYYLYHDGDIIRGKINKTKEELGDNLKKILEIIEIGKKYEINGNDYNMTTTPINESNTAKSTYVDFTLCEEILRKSNIIGQDELVTILQIEIDKMNEKALTSQVEYALYNQQKKN